VSEPDRRERDQASLADILRACHLAVQFIQGLDCDAFFTDQKTQAAVLHEIMILGEGVKRLSDELRTSQPSIPWRLIAGMWDRLIHEYDTVDLEEVWRTVTQDIPTLIQNLERLQSRTGQPPLPE
jgi:uncharacterized protein with HEPN domain